MTNILYIFEDRASSTGGGDDPQVVYSGDKPNRVICLFAGEEILYFTDDREAHAVMQARPIERVRLLPVID